MGLAPEIDTDGSRSLLRNFDSGRGNIIDSSKGGWGRLPTKEATRGCARGLADTAAGGPCCCRHDDGTAADDDDAGDAVPKPHVRAFQPACSVTRTAPQCEGAALTCPHTLTHSGHADQISHGVGAGGIDMDRTHVILRIKSLHSAKSLEVAHGSVE